MDLEALSNEELTELVHEGGEHKVKAFRILYKRLKVPEKTGIYFLLALLDGESLSEARDKAIQALEMS